MATVKASCPTCGDIEVTTRQVQVDQCTSTRDTTYSFQCPSCRVRVSKPASEKVTGVLTDAGVRVRSWSMPTPRTEVQLGAPIGYDDLLAFHFELDDDHLVARLLSGIR